jgi:hypothetical protein
MFRAFTYPSSGATTAVAASGLPWELGDSSAVFKRQVINLRSYCILLVDSVEKMSAFVELFYQVFKINYTSPLSKLGGEAMVPYLVWLLDITINNGTLPADWKRATVVPIHKGVIDH